MARLGTYLIPGNDFQVSLRQVQLADRLGYESVWVTHNVGRDAFVVLTAYAAATTQIRLCSGIVPIYPRHPMVMAQQALSLNEISGGRFRLGIGVSHGPSMETGLGLDMGKPLAVAREYVEVLRQAFSGSVKHQGERYRITWSYGVSPVPPAPPIILSGLSPRMLELAGEIADGVVLWLAAPEYVKNVVVPCIRRGRERAGKPLDGFEIVAPAQVAITQDTEAAWRSFKEQLANYLALPFYCKAFGQAGYSQEVSAFQARRSQADPVQAVPDRLAKALAAVGTAEAVGQFVGDYVRAGVTLPVIRPFYAPDVERTLQEAIDGVGMKS